MRPAPLIVLSIATVLGSCAGGSGVPAAPPPEESPALEAMVASDPGDAEAALLLASAYREAGRSPDALAVVDGAVAAGAEVPALTVMAGVLHEDQGDLAQARAAYEAYLTHAPDGALRVEVHNRLEQLRLSELQADVRSALAREADLADRAPDPRAVGIFPFTYEGDDAAWAPLGPALTDLLITDLSITGRLRVLERAHIRALVDELALSEAGLVEERTAARGGRLLGSGHIVQGRYRIDDDRRLNVGAAVVSVTQGGDEVRPVNAADGVDRLFDLEKGLALDLHAELGIELTPAERSRVNERQTESIEALLAFGRGLQALDRGDFEAAEAAFTQAANLDPGFALAQARRAQAAAGGRVGTQRLTGRATRLAQRRRAVQALRRNPAALRHAILRNVGQRQRSALAEVLGQDRLGSAILLELVFRRPGGGP